MHVRWKAGRKKGTEKDQGSTQVKLFLPGTLYEIDCKWLQSLLLQLSTLFTT